MNIKKNTHQKKPEQKLAAQLDKVLIIIALIRPATAAAAVNTEME